MATLHVENTVRDFDTWKTAFDKFDRFRADKGMRSYRVVRHAGDRNKVMIDMEFDSPADARTFRDALEQIWRTPQSKGELVSHSQPEVYEVVEHRTL